MIKPLKKRQWTATDVKNLRHRFHLSQQELATIVGVSQQSIQQFESGKYIMKRIAEIAWDKIEEHLVAPEQQLSMQKARKAKGRK